MRDLAYVLHLTRTQSAPFLVPLGVAAHLSRWGVPPERIVEMKWNDEKAIGGLRLVLTEQNHHWWTATIDEFDSAYQSNSWIISDEVPRPPSEYLHDHVFIGASFMAPFEARAAIEEGYVDNVMWGRDYPHVE